MSKKGIDKWILAHAFVLFFVFSFLLIAKPSPKGRWGLPLLPKSVAESKFGLRFSIYVSSIGADQWVYYNISQFLLHGRLSTAYLVYKAKNDEMIPSNEAKKLRLPYRDLSFEYPPLALVPILIPALLTSDFYLYRILYSFLASAAYLTALFTVINIYRDLQGMSGAGRRGNPPSDPLDTGDRRAERSSARDDTRRILPASLLFLLFMGPLVVYRLDIFAAMMVILALRALQKSNPLLSGFFLSLGVATKLYPLILLPLFGLFLIRQDSFKSALRLTGVFVGTLIVIYLPILIFSPEGYLHSLAYHGKRGVEFESLYATWAQIGYLLGFPAEVYQKFGSNNIRWSGEEWVKRYWSLIAILAMGLVYLRYYFQSLSSRAPLAQNVGRGDPPRSRGDTGDCRVARAPRNDREPDFRFYNFLETSFLIILALMITSKVLSPQFLIWLFPLFLLVGMSYRITYPIIFQAALASQMVYPYLFLYLNAFHPFAVLVLAYRNLLLLALFLILMDWGLLFKAIRFSAQKLMSLRGARP